MVKRTLLLAAAAGAASCSGQRDEGVDWGSVSSWVYQLQASESQTRQDFIQDLAATGFDVVVTDYSFDGVETGRFTPGEIDQLKQSNKIVFCYVSIGEAEDYRWYWEPGWDTNPPSWLGPENPNWPGNYLVRFWDPDWQSIVFQYIEIVKSQGFDGLYLDKVDSYEDFADSLPGAADSMKALVSRIADSAAGMLVVPQNASDLLQDPGYLSVIDGIGNEDVYYMDDEVQDPAEVDLVVSNLKLARAEGHPVFVIDYPQDPRNIADFYERARADGFIPYRSVRGLDSLIVNPQDP